MIPKIIHYCWFGRGEKPPKVIDCINSWKKHFPDYEIMEWNEDNFSVEFCRYTKEAYENRKYAFVSDVARLVALEAFGGIYLDTDVEIKQHFGKYLNSELVCAFESNTIVATAFIAANPHNELIQRFLSNYENRTFVTEEGFDMLPNTVVFTKLLEKNGLCLNRMQQVLPGGITVYPTEIFGAFDADSMAYCETRDTVLIHHCLASWADSKLKLRFTITRFVSKILGKNNYKRIKRLLRRGKRS